MTEKPVINERAKLRLERDFDPSGAAGASLSPDVRVANALEYVAYQLGQINRKLDALIEAPKGKR